MFGHTKMKTLRMLGIVALAFSLAACTKMTGRSAGRNVDDAGITAAVKAKLASEGAVTLTSVDVDTVSGTVYLTGTVLDAAAKQRAGEIARQTDGAVRVVNNLHTRTAGDAPRGD
jgi:osmotically-inducible protein OsmY